ncbi:hypothetical protein [Glycomyces artemisiae]|uniref:Subtilisin inhibitor-like n=1 Tax=Glycomyces artemisiae TaxID=1076443 RepID=A0A2T0UXD0_9ACTN|nr:hypothetical protein [Glycomyces artemisiae]PRY62544.1 hypothetical protein B0I28_101878 [Glycomyces artemisiae]
MNRSIDHRRTMGMALAALLAAAAFALTFALTASPAHAADTGGPAAAVATAADGDVSAQTSADCVYYLRAVGYEVGPKRTQACNTGGSGSWGAKAFCMIGLMDGGVSEYHADNACTLAAR